MKTLTIVILALSLAVANRASAIDTPLDAAINLYMSAAYEDALAALGELPAGADADQADKYRALCLLGLNRPQEAEAAVERLVSRQPLLEPGDGESPKLVLMYREARARVIPAAAKTLYATAKDHFENGQIAASATEFRRVLALISEVDVTTDAALKDLKMLAEGFSKLAEEQAPKSPSNPIRNAPATNNQTAAVQAPAPVGRLPEVFDANNRDVAPPVPISQPMPAWTAPVYRDKPHSGTIELVVDEKGRVIASEIITPINPAYDQQLLRAARGWQYKPAQKANQPVKYRMAIEIVLMPPPG